MYLIYVDDSGKPEETYRSNLYFCLSAIIVCEQDWKALDDAINQLKYRHSISEIHTRNLYTGTKEFNYLSQYPETRIRILGDIFSLIAQSDITLVSSVINKPEYYAQYSENDVEERAWKHLIERCDMGIADLSRQNNNLFENGLIITDHYTSDKHDEKIRSLLQIMRIYGTGFHSVKYIIEDPLFTISKFRNFIQLADAVAYCTVNFLLEDQFFKIQFETIRHRFRALNGEIRNIGLKIFPWKAKWSANYSTPFL